MNYIEFYFLTRALKYNPSLKHETASKQFDYAIAEYKAFVDSDIYITLLKLET